MNNPLHIVLIAHFAGSPHHGMVYGHYYLSREWVQAGHRVTIVAAAYAHTRFKQPQARYKLVEEYIDGIRYLWVPTFRYSPNSKFGRVLNILNFVFRCSVVRLPIRNADLVICSSHYPFAIHPAYSLARRLNAKLVFEVRDLWPLTLVELGGASPKSLFIRAMQWSENFAYLHADKVVSVLEGSYTYMVQHGMKPEKFLFVPNGIDLSDCSIFERLPQSHIDLIEAYRKQNCFIVGYAGRVGLSNALHSLIGAVARCNNPKIVAVILGDGSHVENLKKLSEQLKIQERVLFLNSVRKSQVKDFLSRIDAAYIGLQNQPLFRYGVSPTKLNDYMLASKPIIYGIESPGDIVAKNMCGITCRAENETDISSAIERLCSLDPQALRDMGERGRKWIFENRDYRILADLFLKGVLN